MVGVRPLHGLGGLGSLFFIAISVIGLAVSYFSPTAVQQLRTAATEITAPVLYAVSKPFQDATHFLRSASGLAEMQAANQELMEENQRLRSWHHKAMTLTNENKELRRLLNMKPIATRTVASARVIGDHTSSFAKTIIINAGDSDKIAKNQPVIGDNGLVGRVIETSPSTSRVLLVNDVNSRIPVMIEGSNVHAVLAGQNNNTGLIEHLPPGTLIEGGARIVTSGYGGVFPPGLPIGRIKTVSLNVPEDPNAIVNPEVDFYTDVRELFFVRILDHDYDPRLITSAP